MRLGEAVLTSTHKLCFKQKYEKYQNFLSENFHILVVKFSAYLNRYVFIMRYGYRRRDKITTPQSQKIAFLDSQGCKVSSCGERRL